MDVESDVSPVSHRRSVMINQLMTKYAVSKMIFLDWLFKIDLEVLELHGLGKNVTNNTAFFGFQGAHSLRELYLFSPSV
jgi:hypothetical protein